MKEKERERVAWWSKKRGRWEREEKGVEKLCGGGMEGRPRKREAR